MGMYPGGRVGSRAGARRVRHALCLLALPAFGLISAAPASAHRFPVPRCGWARPSLIDKTFGLQVNASKPYWTTQIAPVLHCNYLEQQPSLQEVGEPIVSLEFREIQRFKVQPGMTPVKALGSCRVHISCPKGTRQAAWIYMVDSAGSSSSTAFTSGLLLEVEDGLNQITIEVENPFGPLPVSNEEDAAIHLAKKLVPRFRYK